MARYTGPKTKISRKFGTPLFGDDKSFQRKNYPPGQHGANKRRGKKSEYALQLSEKQKAKYTYGILEKQFSNLFKNASSKLGITGEVLLQLCESRLDNIVYRLSFARTRSAARQLVSHCHICVNGSVVNIPSYQLKPGDVIAIRERSKSLESIISSISDKKVTCEWVTLNEDLKQGIYVTSPTREQIPEGIKEQLIVELYSK